MEQKTSEAPSLGGLAERLIAVAVPVATELCQHGAMACLPCVVGVESARATMIVTTGLLQAMLFHVGHAYRESNERDAPAWLMRRVKGAIAQGGDARFGNAFSTVWRKSDDELHAQDTTERIHQSGATDPFRQRLSCMVECVNWALRELNEGQASDLMRTNQLLFCEIVSTFNFFNLRNEALIDLGKLAVGLTKPVDLESLRPAKVRYDVFISYRRSDGLAFARLLKQELERRGDRCFLDVDKIEAGQYNPQILSSLRSADNIVFLMTKEAIANLDDPDNPVRIELETARKLGRAVTVVAAPGTSRSLDGVALPESLEFLRGLQKYRLELGEFFDESVDKIMTQGFAVRRCRLVKFLRRLFN